MRPMQSLPGRGRRSSQTRRVGQLTAPLAGQEVWPRWREKSWIFWPPTSHAMLRRARVMVLPLVILGLAFWQSWAVGVVLLISGPLIPVFMALVGMAAKEASARQMAEIGTLNDFLVERLSALLDIRLLGARTAVLQGFERQAGDLRRRTMAVLGVVFLSSTVLELFAAIGVAMVAVYVGFSLLGALEFGAWALAVRICAVRHPPPKNFGQKLDYRSSRLRFDSMFHRLEMESWSQKGPMKRCRQ